MTQLGQVSLFLFLVFLSIRKEDNVRWIESRGGNGESARQTQWGAGTNALSTQAAYYLIFVNKYQFSNSSPLRFSFYPDLPSFMFLSPPPTRKSALVRSRTIEPTAPQLHPSSVVLETRDSHIILPAHLLAIPDSTANHTIPVFNSFNPVTFFSQSTRIDLVHDPFGTLRGAFVSIDNNFLKLVSSLLLSYVYSFATMFGPWFERKIMTCQPHLTSTHD